MELRDKKEVTVKKTKKTESKSIKTQDEQKLFAFLATFLSIVGFIIAIIAKKNDKYVMYYAKQSLIVFIAFIVSEIVHIVPVVGKIASGILYVITIVLWIFSWVYALSGKTKETPIIGQYGETINL